MTRLPASPSPPRLRPALADRLRPLAAWWQGRDPRERRIVRWGAAILVPVVVVFGLWLPLTERVHKLAGRVGEARAEVAEMRGMQAAWRGRGGDAVRAALPVDLAARLEAELNAAQPAFKGNVRASEDGAELSIEAASFDALLSWLAQVGRRDGLFPREVQLAPVASPGSAGLVGGRIRLQAAGG